MISTDEGMQIDERDEQSENAHLPIRETLEPQANVTVETVSHEEKQNSQRISTDEGMQIDERDEQSENANPPTLKTVQSLSNTTLETCSLR
jgi:hypothetical protein